MGNDEGSSKSDESSSSSSSSEGEKMEVEDGDKGRYAEDIPQAELSQSLHQSEVSFDVVPRGERDER